MAGVTIGKVAAAGGGGGETGAVYQRRGLLALPERQDSGFREYSEADRWRLAFIRRARQLGFTLGEIGELLGPAEARSTDEIARAAQTKLEAIDQQPGASPGYGARRRRGFRLGSHAKGTTALGCPRPRTT